MSDYDIVVLAASAGGVSALGDVVAGLPADFPLPLVVVQHRSAEAKSFLDEILARRTRLRVKNVLSGEALQPGTVYVAPPNRHVTLRPDGTFALVNGRRIRHVQSSANPLLESAASVLRGRVLAVVLTGYGSDGTDGVQSVKAWGGTVIAQDRASSQAFGMPLSAIRTGAVDLVLPLNDIAPMLVRLAGRQGAEN